MAITVLADLRFAAGATDSGLRALAEMLPDTRGFDGCVNVIVAQDQADPTHILLIESWRSTSDHQAYMTWRASSATNTGLRDALAAAPVITYLDERSEI